jgi:hypothetical protein
VKGIEILIFESFDIVYDCVKSIAREWCDTIITNKILKNERIFV